MPTVKNIIIFLAIGVILSLVYIFVIKQSPPETPLVSSTSNSVVSDTGEEGTNSVVAQDFLNSLLSVRKIKIDDSIFSDVAFTSLDPSPLIDLTPDGTEGRVNPFAPFAPDATTTDTTQLKTVAPATP